MRFVVGGCLWFLGLFGCSLSVAGLFCFVILCLLCCSAFGLLLGFDVVIAVLGLICVLGCYTCGLFACVVLGMVKSIGFVCGMIAVIADCLVLWVLLWVVFLCLCLVVDC